MLEHNITIAWRNIHKYLSQNIISVAGLAASLVCFSICMHIIRFYGEAYDTVENHERIVSIMGKSSYSLYSPHSIIRTLWPEVGSKWPHIPTPSC